MPRPDNIVGGDIVVREFSQTYLIWRVRGGRSLASSHQGLGQRANRDEAISKACEVAGSAHAVWFCDTNERYRRIG